MSNAVSHSPLLVRIPPQLKQWLNNRAKENSRTMTGEIVQMLKAAAAAEQVRGGEHDA